MKANHLQSFPRAFVAPSAPCATGLMLLLGFSGLLRAEVLLEDDFSNGLGAWNTEGLVVLENGKPNLYEGAVVPELWTGGRGHWVHS